MGMWFERGAWIGVWDIGVEDGDWEGLNMDIEAWQMKTTKICPQLSRRSLESCRFSEKAEWAEIIQHSHQIMNALRSFFSFIKILLVRAFRKARTLSPLIFKISEITIKLKYKKQRCVAYLNSSILTFILKKL